ncbi:MAG: crossover junction endodeoxyribonuclease RuvC [Fibrobacter sp.]|jgi:crossover junction endodeoxyribonuclease RuvC|nr:crossover junction endodeoxyribonuclease RuvC [Fibrobacter sp.]
MIILGIDPGSYTTGYAFLKIESGKRSVLEYGIIACKAALSLEDRLLKIVSELELLITRYRPQILSMESAFFAKNVKSAMILGHVRGAVMAACRKKGMEFAEYSPRSVKQAVTGNGAASKEQVSLMVCAHLRLREISEKLDATDALAIAWTHASSLEMPGVFTARKRNSKNAMRDLVLRIKGELP